MLCITGEGQGALCVRLSGTDGAVWYQRGGELRIRLAGLFGAVKHRGGGGGEGRGGETRENILLSLQILKAVDVVLLEHREFTTTPCSAPSSPDLLSCPVPAHVCLGDPTNRVDFLFASCAFSPTCEPWFLIVQEFSTSNFFAVTADNKFVTPDSPAVLPSITNKSLMQLAEDKGMVVEHRPVPFEEVASFKEVGACGTAMVMATIKQIVKGGEVRGRGQGRKVF